MWRRRASEPRSRTSLRRGEGALRGGEAGFAHPDSLGCEDDEAKRLKIASVSSKPTQVLNALLQNLAPDMSSYFDLVVSSDDALRFGNGDQMKPEPDCYNYAKKVLDLSNSIAFEDTQISGESPSRAGIFQ